jgi:hypothetical protein
VVRIILGEYPVNAQVLLVKFVERLIAKSSWMTVSRPNIT